MPTRRITILATAICCLMTVSALFGQTSSLTGRDLEEALAVARSPEAARAAFHAPYVFHVSAALPQIEIITEFRRAVLITEDHLTRGEWIFGQGGSTLAGENVRDALAPWRGKTSVVAHVQFDPRNAYATAPPMTIELDTLPSLTSAVTPQASFPFGTAGQLTTSLVGADVETSFSAEQIGHERRTVVVHVGEQRIGQISVDLSRLR
jgi:hypothetical protein